MSEAKTIVIELGSVKVNLDMDGWTPPQPQTSAVTKSSFVLGAVSYSRADLEKYRAKNQRVKVNTVGMCHLADDVTPALALDVIASVRVLGFIQAQNDVRSALMQAGKIL